MNRPTPSIFRNGGFTLVEIMVASIAAALVLLAVYGIFQRAMKIRDSDIELTRQARLDLRARNVLRNDLRNALVSGGILAATLQGDSSSSDSGDSAFPGYLKLTTTTGKDATDEMYGDVEQVEYYIVTDKTKSGTQNGGTLMRIATRDLLNSTPAIIHQEQILSGVQSFRVSFYDGASWQTSWPSSSASTTTTTASATASSTPVTLPSAIRVDIQMAAPVAKKKPPAPLEVLVQWKTAPFLSGTNFTIGSSSSGTTTQ